MVQSSWRRFSFAPRNSLKVAEVRVFAVFGQQFNVRSLFDDLVAFHHDEAVSEPHRAVEKGSVRVYVQEGVRRSAPQTETSEHSARMHGLTLSRFLDALVGHP